MIRYKNESWVEKLSFTLFIVGFVLATISGSAVISYATIFFLGMIVGIFWFKIKKHVKIPYFFIILGLLIGYLVGSFYGEKLVVLIFFIIGSLTSYYLHTKKYF